MSEVRSAADGDWADVETVMGATGGSVGCWCTFWRLTNVETQGRTAADNQETLRSIVAEREHGGLLLYDDGEPVGWCSVAPRDDYARVFRTKGIAPADPAEPSVWSVVCILVRKSHRGAGVSDRLLAAAVDYALEHGAAVVEGYPLADKDSGRASGRSSGTIGMFRRAGFSMFAEPSEGRRMVMRYVHAGPSGSG